MGGILELGIAIILFLQSLGDWLTGPMVALSFLGTEPFFLLVAPAFLWCVDAAWGVRAGLALALCNTLNAGFKMAIHGPRPYWFDARVQPFSAETTFGAPSGHAVNAVAVWGVLAAWANRRVTWIIAILLMFLIGFSRLYLGMHFPHDVLLGWLVGAATVVIILRGEKAIKPWLERSRPGTIALAAFGVSIALILINAAIRASVQNWTLPEAWVALSQRAVNADPIDPLSLEGVIATMGVFFGVSTGAVLLKARGWFDAGGPLDKRLMRYIIGLLGMMVFYIGLDYVFPEGDNLVGIVFRYLRYALVGLWISFLAPELFIRLGIARRSEPAPGAFLEAGRKA